MEILFLDKKVAGKSKAEQMTERQQELERRLQDVTGQLGSNKKSTKKGKCRYVFKISKAKTVNSHIENLFVNHESLKHFKLILDDSSKINPQNQSRQSSSSSSSDSSSSSSSDSSSSDSSDSEAG